MMRRVETVYENGVLRPLEPLALAAEHQHVAVVITEAQPVPERSHLDADYLAAVRAEVRSMGRIPTLDEIHKITSIRKIQALGLKPSLRSVRTGSSWRATSSIQAGLRGGDGGGDHGREQRVLRAVAGLKERGQLERELLGMRMGRGGREHDDLVMAVALACWRARRRGVIGEQGRSLMLG